MNFSKFFCVSIGMLFFPLVNCFPQYVLSNIATTTPLVTYEYSPSCYGYYAGHNCYGRDIYAEKYYINGSATIIGIASIHTGTIQLPERVSSFDIYQVGANTLPYPRIAGKEVKYSDIKLNGDSTKILFDTPISVKDSFFVAWSILNYAHESFTDTIGLLCGSDGSRPESDLVHKGRNSVMLHDLGWADFYAKTGLKTNLALFPILASAPTSITNSFSQDYSLHVIYPEQSGSIKLSYILKSTSQVNVDIYDITGKLTKQIDLGSKIPGEHLDDLIIKELSQGIYTLLFHTDEAILVKKIWIQ